MATAEVATPGAALAYDRSLMERAGGREPLVLGRADLASVTDDVCQICERPQPPAAWYIAFAISFPLMLMMFASLGWLVWKGIGIWGLNSPVFWGWDITHLVVWIGIGHAGTLISAILYLFRQDWRTAINRSAEAMTIFAVMCAGIFPTFHVGRVWVAYWLAPYPNTMGPMWPNFKSPLLWDVFAVSTYFSVSLMFWYMGLLPDIATLRDRATNTFSRVFYGVLALGWTGSSRAWHRYEKAYGMLAGMSTPLVLSVHTVVSFDFATSVIPGWHTTIFPPYFVAGAIFGGFAMVATLLVPARALFKLEHIVTMKHIELMNKIILATGMIVGYAYSIELFTAWYSGSPYERFAFLNRALGPYAWAYWSMVTCNVIAPQLFWFKWCRTNLVVTMIVCMFVNVGMWFERFVIIVTSLHRDFLPSSWHMFFPTAWDISLFVGSIGMFLTLFLMFCRFLPMVAIAEVKGVMPKPSHGGGHGHAPAGGPAVPAAPAVAAAH
jgi:molybdopterin-containing oxidoreductase family membrane subunit